MIPVYTLAEAMAQDPARVAKAQSLTHEQTAYCGCYNIVMRGNDTGLLDERRMQAATTAIFANLT